MRLLAPAMHTICMIPGRRRVKGQTSKSPKTCRSKARFAFVLLAATFIMLGTALAAEGDRVDARFEIYGFARPRDLT